jgi:LPXTG-motif cell wall-anchored protein
MTTASTSNTTSTTSSYTYTTQTTKIATSSTITSTSVTTVTAITLPSQSGAYVTVSGGGYIHMYDMFKVYVDYDLSQCKPEKITGQLLMQNFRFNPSLMYIISVTSSCGTIEADLETGEYTILFTEEEQDVKNCRVTFRMENLDSGPYGEYFTESVDTTLYDNDGNEIPVLDMKKYHLQVAPPDTTTDPLPQTGNNSPKTASAAACAALLIIAGGLAMYRSRRDEK